MKYSKNGFTMTEIVIVITLIGVLALILVPTIKNMLPDKDNVKYKKAFTTIQETINLMINDPNVCQRYNANTGTTITDQLQFCNTVAESANAALLYDYTPRNLYQELCSRLNTTTDVDCTNYAVNGCQNIITPSGINFAVPTVNFDNNFGNDPANPVTINVDLDGNAIACNSATGVRDSGRYSIIIDKTGRVYASGAVERELLLSDPKNSD